MKKTKAPIATLTLTLTLVLLMLAATACSNHAATAPVPGSLNSYDAYAFRVLADTQAALNAFRADVVSGKVTETATIRAAFNQATTDYNIAEAAYLAWHSAGGTGTTTTLAAQIATAQTDITNLLGGAL